MNPSAPDLQGFADAAWRLFWRDELPWLLLGAALVALALWRGLRDGRRALRNTVLFLALCVLAELAGAMLETAGAARSGTLVRGAAIVATGLALIRLGGLALFRAALPATGFAAPRIVEEVALLLAYVAWGMLRLRLAGMDLASLVTTSAVITAVAAFAMQDTLGNVLGGLFLELDRSLAVGDWIRIDDLSGRVTDIHWRHTTIRTRNGELVIVPNSALMKSRFTVLGNPDRREVRWRRWIWFDVDLEVPTGEVIRAAEQALAAAEVPNVARAPAPDCVLMDFEHGCCRYALRYWLADPQHDDGTDSAVRVHVLAALRRAGITICLPTHVIHDVRETPRREAARAERETASRVTALRAVDLFSTLSDDELHTLSRHLVPAPFAAGDVITRQGAVAHWLYILTRGEAEVWVEAADAPRRGVAVLAPPNVFGEMGMMTGEPRHATVSARTDVHCYRLDKTGFEQVLRARPAIAGALAQVLSARATGLAQAVEQAQADAAASARAHADTLLARIQSFFGLASGTRGAT
ncbi:MAG: mechanosensitive ion channel domain-containing protein [Betaproteobacteria bacterium]